MKNSPGYTKFKSARYIRETERKRVEEGREYILG
jgi:hypothetical protein